MESPGMAWRPCPGVRAVCASAAGQRPGGAAERVVLDGVVRARRRPLPAGVLAGWGCCHWVGGGGCVACGLQGQRGVDLGAGAVAAEADGVAGRPVWPYRDGVELAEQ